MKINLVIVSSIIICAGFSAKADVEDRIAPVGKVELASPAPSLEKSVQPTAQPPVEQGEQVYKQYCAVCHAAGIAGSPRFQNAEDWKPRLSKGVDGLLKSAATGLNTMPPKGTCTTCTDEQLKAAVEYMLPNS